MLIPELTKTRAVIDAMLGDAAFLNTVETIAHVGVEVLTDADDIAFPAAVADADVEIAIRTKGDLAAVVIAVGEVELHKHLDAVHVRLIRLVLLRFDLGDHGGAVEPQIGVAEEDAAVLFELRMEGDAEEAELEEGADGLILDVEEGLFVHLAVFDDLDHARTLGHEKAAAAIRCACDGDRIDEVTSDLHEGDFGFDGQFAAGLDGLCREGKGQRKGCEECGRCFHGEKRLEAM